MRMETYVVNGEYLFIVCGVYADGDGLPTLSYLQGKRLGLSGGLLYGSGVLVQAPALA